jgi:hypothetical protein
METGISDLKIELRTLIESLSHERLLKVYEYAKSLKDGPKGNTCRECSFPLGRCECEGCD